jgi:putative acetyltransferase
MDIIIRNETEKDFKEVEKLIREAFWNLYIPGCNEHCLAHQIRKHSDFIKELSLIAEYKGEIIGQIMFTKAQLIGENSEEIEILNFGPFCILPKYQRQGIGSLLFNHAKNIALKRGAKGIVIYGYPHHYFRYGFKNGIDYNISDMNGKYPYALLALELEKQAFKGSKWKFKYSDVYDNINPKEVEKFDKNFIPKEKSHQSSQDVFSITLRSYISPTTNCSP